MIRTMKTYSSREIIRILRRAGWMPVRQKGSHLQLAHPGKPGLVTVPHPRREIGSKTLRTILKQAGLAISDLNEGGSALG